MSAQIVAVRGHQVLDSRGWPTVEVGLTLTTGQQVRASVPSGRSKSSHEAYELRDGETGRFGGRGVGQAVHNVNTLIGPKLIGRDPTEQADLDTLLIDLDGTPDKSRLGANAILAVSVAVARAGAAARQVALWQHLGDGHTPVLPLPMVNIISGGLHAGGNLDIQDFLVVPVGAKRFSQALEMCLAVHAATAALLERYGLSILKADEGGFGPALESNVAALELLTDAITAAGYAPGTDLSLAIDVAATHLFDARSGHYQLRRDKRARSSAQMVELLRGWAARYPIVSIEDGLAEDDWAGWQQLNVHLGDTMQILGDDLFATSLARLERGIQSRAANAILVKMNQVGTLTETLQVVQRSRQAGLRAVISARSGETEDAALADLAVATGVGQIKIGSLAQSDRLAKYNQLLRIEDQLGADAQFAGARALLLLQDAPGPGSTP